MFDSFPWLFLTVGGPVVLALVFGIALFQRRNVSRRDFQAGEEATRRHYDEKDDTPSAPNAGM